MKICGNRSERDLRFAVQGGADAVGLICGVTHVSEDALTAWEAARLATAVPPYVCVVLVTHLQEPGQILDLAAGVGADTIQLHGEIDPAVTAAVRANTPFGRRLTQAVHVTSREAMARAEAFAPHCDAILLDSRTADRLGGTGQTHDWAISRQITDRLRELGRPTILAGGLTAENVADAIRTVAPFGVDVNSGTDGHSGDKSAARIAAFAEAISAVDRLPVPA